MPIGLMGWGPCSSASPYDFSVSLNRGQLRRDLQAVGSNVGKRPSDLTRARLRLGCADRNPSALPRRGAPRVPRLDATSDWTMASPFVHAADGGPPSDRRDMIPDFGRGVGGRQPLTKTRHGGTREPMCKPFRKRLRPAGFQ